jgi:hypothetical protein
MGLNRSTYQSAKELDLDRGDVQAMTTTLRRGLVERRPEPTLSGEVGCDEVDVVAGHKGNPEVVIRMLGDVQQATIGPLIERTIAQGYRLSRRVRYLQPFERMGIHPRDVAMHVLQP